jgi:2-iminoacetate synthase
MRDVLVNLGVSQVSAESRVTPSRYENTSMGTPYNDKLERQFSVNDHRTLDEIVKSLLLQGFMPSCCDACYRKNRTSEHFVDFAKPELKKLGYSLIE